MTDEIVAGAVASAQIKGARDCQEDSLAVQVLAGDGDAGERLLILADGMGGHAGGAVASRLTVESFCAAYVKAANGMGAGGQGSGDIPGMLGHSLYSANEALANAVADRPELGGMGTTLIGCVIRGDQLYWISVGDSPLWLCRDGRLQRLNADHSMVPLLDDMVRTGIMDRQEALADTRRHMLRSAVAGKTLELIDVCERPCRLQADDIVMLASDGVETLAGEQLLAVLSKAGDRSLQALASDLMASIKAIGHGGQDNATVILYRPGQAS